MQLTERQRELAGLLTIGMDMSGIAQRMGVSRHTAKAHIRDIRIRLGVESDAALRALLREMQRHPVEHVLEQCRREPRKWCDV